MNWNSFFNSNLPSTLATILAAFVAFLVYRKQKSDAKRDAAKIILQEIRRAEDIVSDYKQNGGYQFAKKIIATNSWNNNIHLFVGDLDNDELDRISNLYSTGEYLDTLIKEISDYTFKKEIEGPTLQMNAPATPLNVQQQGQTVNLEAVQQATPQRLIHAIPINLASLISPWKARLDIITFKLEPIYHSTIAEKLKKIAQLQ